MSQPAENQDNDNTIYMQAIGDMPAILKYAHIVYNILLDRAKVEEVEIPTIFHGVEPAVTVPVFRGRLLDVYEAAKASKGYHSQIRRILIDAGSIAVLERGTIHNPSVVVVDPEKRPPMSLTSINVKSGDVPLTEQSDTFKLLDRRVQTLENSLGGLSIVKAMRDFEVRLAKLEGSAGSRVG